MTLYPSLDPQEFRLKKISEVEAYFKSEIEQRRILYKKYKRTTNVVDGVDTALTVVSLGTGVAGVCLLTTIVAAPLVVALEVVSLGCGVLSMAGSFISRRLATKVRKHDEIRLLAETKLNTIADHISKALHDNAITEEEFRLILDEAEKYSIMKKDIQATARKAHASVVVDDATKNELIARGRAQERESFIKKLTVVSV